MDPEDLVTGNATPEETTEGAEGTEGEGTQNVPFEETDEFKTAVDERVVTEKKMYDPIVRAYNDPRYKDAIAAMVRGEELPVDRPAEPVAPTGPAPNPYDAIGQTLSQTLGENEGKSVQAALEPIMRQLVSVNEAQTRRAVEEIKGTFEKKIGEVSGSLDGLKSISNLDTLLRSEAEVLPGIRGRDVAHLRDRFIKTAETRSPSIQWEDIMSIELGPELAKNGANSIRQRRTASDGMTSGQPGGTTERRKFSRTPYKKDQGERSFQQVWGHQGKGATSEEIEAWGEY